MTERIQSFNGSLVAFYRRVKKTYFIMRWSEGRRSWDPYDEAIAENTISRHHSTAHPGTTSVQMNIRRGRGGTEMISARTNGFFLLLPNNEKVPILYKYGGSMPGPCIKREYTTAPVGTNEPYHRTDILWTNAGAPDPTPDTPPTSSLKPIPRRIAWMIAEDACKKEDVCPITMDIISPLEASVTSCYHCFDTNAIAEWFTNNSKCPVCKEKCVVTKAYEEVA